MVGLILDFFMNSDHYIKTLIGKLSRAMGSDLAHYTFADSELVLYFKFPTESRDRKLLRQIISGHLPRNRVKFDKKSCMIRVYLL